MSWYYYEVGDLWICWSAAKAYGPCPFTETNGRGVAPGWLQAVFDESGDPDVRKLDASALFVNAHRSTRHSDDPSRCGGCGAPRPFLGWRTWINEPWPDEETIRQEIREGIGNVETLDEATEADAHIATALSTRAMNLRLGNTHRERPGSARYWPLRREAKSWVTEQTSIEKRALADESATSAG